jgi:transposase
MENVIGIDISKSFFDVHFSADGRDRRYDYSPENVNLFMDQARKAAPALIVMEATGGYENLLASELMSAGLPTAVVNPKRIRDFARAAGQTAKTDRMDARIIARFAAVMQPPPDTQADETVRLLRPLTARRRQLTDMRTAEKNRLEHADEASARSIREMISFIGNDQFYR